MFVSLYITRPRGITSTKKNKAIAVGPRHVYNVIYKDAKNKIVVQKKTKVSFFVCFKVLTVSYAGGMVGGHEMGLG